MSATREVVLKVEHWPLHQPFRISDHTWMQIELLVCEVREGACTGRGEAMGVYYRGDQGSTMQAQVERVIDALRAGADRRALLDLLPAGGARNAVDSAVWDLEAQQTGTSAWTRAGVRPAPVTTVFTIGLEGTPAEMAVKARAAADRPHLKIKLNADQPVERMRAIRAARPDATLVVDVNGGWSFEQLRQFAPALRDLGVRMIEQPLPRGGDAALQGYEAPLPLFADESCLDLHELDHAAVRYQGLVVKLDKAGGLTSALQLAAGAKERGLRLMVGCMVGTSLSMAPAHVLAQLAEIVDIDGPLLLARDRADGLRYDGATVSCPSPVLWGTPRAEAGRLGAARFLHRLLLERWQGQAGRVD